MAVVTGLGSQFSLKAESTYGTSVTPDRGFTLLSETLSLDIARIDSKTLKGGNYLTPQSAIRAGRKRGGGDVQGLQYNHGMGLLWTANLGTVATTGTNPYTHTVTMGGTLPSYTGEVTIGGTSSVMRKRMTGMMVDSWAVALASGENCTFGQTWVYQDETLATSSSTSASLASTLVPYNFADGTITLASSTAGCVRSININGNNNLAADDVCIGSTSISQPVRGGFAEITGDMEVELDPTTTNLYDRFVAGSWAALVLLMTDGTNTCTITANVILNGSSPTVGGPGKVTLKVPFMVSAPTTDASGFSVVMVNTDSVA